jgi:hypothetical protein
MDGSPRYRVEEGRACIDIKIRNVHQLFDLRDPSPFLERDLEEDAVDYIVGAAKDIGPAVPLKIVVWISEPSSPGLDDSTIADAIRGHFSYELVRLRRRARDEVREGQLALVLGTLCLMTFLTLAKLTPSVLSGRVGEILSEGFVIMGWVAMWRPLDVLLYEWWPLARQRRLLTWIRDAEIAIAR